MAFRVVHLADLHLDIPFSGLGRSSQLSNARREGLRQALKRALELAKEWPADALTIGGDLYEADHISSDTVEFLHQQFEQAAPLKIFISPGNHDPCTRSSPYAYRDWPANVYIFREPHLVPVTLKDGLTLWGAGHDTATFMTPLLTHFRLPTPSPALLLLHGTDHSVSLSHDKRSFCPFGEGEVRSAGFDLALLGHIHHQRLHPKGKPLICYPGSPEPLGFDEEEGHSILLAEWANDQWRVEARDISQWACRRASIDISNLASRDNVIERIRNLWPEAIRGKRCLARVELVGQPASSLDLDLAAMHSVLSTEFAELILDDRTVPPFDIVALRQDNTVVGAFVRRMLQEIELTKNTNDEPQRMLLEKALTYGLTALGHREIRSP